MSVALIMVGVVTSGLIIGLFATATAPVGYEDESGFHFGPQQGASRPNRKRTPMGDVPSAARLAPKPA